MSKLIIEVELENSLIEKIKFAAVAAVEDVIALAEIEDEEAVTWDVEE